MVNSKIPDIIKNQTDIEATNFTYIRFPDPKRNIQIQSKTILMAAYAIIRKYVKRNPIIVSSAPDLLLKLPMNLSLFVV